MNDYFPDNFVDYNDPPLSSTDFTSDQKEFSLPSPNSDSTGNFQISYSPKGLGNYPENDQLNFDLMSYYNQQHEVPVQNQVPETSKKGSRKKAKPAATPAYTDASNEISQEASPDNKILDKSKRIQKREIAKERTKQKLDITTLFQGVDKKFLPEGYDDPNLDERSKKKMIQMVRNRISAQNSRDRKKNFMSQLEEQNAQLEEDIARITEERDRLAAELQSANNEIEILRTRGGQGCAHCQPILKEDDFIVTGDIEQNADGIPAGGFSGLASPRLMRFGSSKASLFGLFAFTCFIGMIAFSNIGEQGFTMQGNGLKLHGRNLAAEPAQKVLKEKTLVLQNIQEIMSNFQENSELTFKTYLHKNRIFTGMTIQESMKMLKNSVIDAKANKNAIVEYSEPRPSNLRRNEIPVISNNAPALTYSNGSPLHSTLFCNSGYEFYSEGSQGIHESGSGELVANTSLALEKAEYLQLLVPKATIIKSNVKGNVIRDIYGQPIIPDNSSDDTMYEIWCKVFMVREIGSTY